MTLPETSAKAKSASPVATVVAWDRAGLVPEHDFMRRYSRQHIVLAASDHALCGTRVRWLYISPGDSERCERCFGLAAKRGYVTEYGDPIGANE